MNDLNGYADMNDTILLIEMERFIPTSKRMVEKDGC